MAESLGLTELAVPSEAPIDRHHRSTLTIMLARYAIEDLFVIADTLAAHPMHFQESFGQRGKIIDPPSAVIQVATRTRLPDSLRICGLRVIRSNYTIIQEGQAIFMEQEGMTQRCR